MENQPKKYSNNFKKNPPFLSTLYKNFTFTTVTKNTYLKPAQKNKKISMDSNPWENFQREDLEEVLVRLSDSPEALYKTIKKKKQLVKFHLMKDDRKQEEIMKKIREKERNYEEMLKEMMKKNEKVYFESNLPIIKYVTQNEHTKKVNNLAETIKFR